VLFLSGMRWLVRIAIIAVVVGLVAGSVRSVDFQGNLVPVAVHFRWDRPRAEVRAAERARQGKAAEIPIPAASAEDFPEYRNRNRDGVITGPKLARDWQARPPRKLWQETVGGGYAGVAVVGPVAVTIEQVGGDEAVVCYDADTGKERWNYSYKGLFSEAMGGDGPRATPTIADGDVYSLGATGKLVRLDGATGKPKWEVDILAGNVNIQWGMSGSPLVYDRYVVVNPGAQTDAAKGKAVVAYDRETGHVLWAAGDRKAGYSSPELATLGGVRQVLVLDADAIAAFDPATGKELWSHEWKTNPEVNVAQPLVLDGDRVFVSSGYGHGCVLLKVTQADGKWSAEPVWQNTNLKCKFTSPVYRDGYIYGIDESAGSLTCLDAKDGKRKWKEGRYGNGQILLAGDLIVIGTENGRLALVEANPAAYHELASVPVLPGIKNWNHLTLARGRAYVRNHEVMACYELPTEK
jgi:outer membrane protein assembly factor BamB